MPCIKVYSYQYFIETYCLLHLGGQTQQVLLKYAYSTTKLCGAASQKTIMFCSILNCSTQGVLFGVGEKKIDPHLLEKCENLTCRWEHSFSKCFCFLNLRYCTKSRNLEGQKCDINSSH